MHILFSNKKITLNYFILDKYEAGIVLQGFEVKSLVQANANIDQAFIVFKNNEAYIINMYIAPYKHASTHVKLDPNANHKLLLNKNEIIKIQNKAKKEKLAVVPSIVYLSKNKIKIEICLCKSKHHADKREDIKKRDAKREARRYSDI